MEMECAIVWLHASYGNCSCCLMEVVISVYLHTSRHIFIFVILIISISFNNSIILVAICSIGLCWCCWSLDFCFVVVMPTRQMGCYNTSLQYRLHRRLLIISWHQTSTSSHSINVAYLKSNCSFSTRTLIWFLA